MKNNKNKSAGITLIALVVTIIVLLILAGISITMLSGDNGILQKATTAKENVERAEIIENAKMDVLNEITENKGNDLMESQLKDVLKEYFINSEIPEELPSDLSTLELTTLNNKYKIKVSEIYDGKFSNNSSKSNTSLGLGDVNEDYKSQFGYLVTGYNSAKGLNWRLFYADSNNAYLISDGLGSTQIDGLSWFGTSKISDLGKELNKKYTENSSWEQKNDGTNLNRNIKGIASLLDTTKWLDYKTEYANWAVGAPTLEMFIKSYNATHQTQLDCKVDENAIGYLVGKNTSGGVVSSYNSGIDGFEGAESGMEAAIYFRDYEYTGYFLASPYSYFEDVFSVYYSIDDEEGYLANAWGGPVEIRPIVSVPISKITDGTITIINKFFN